MTHAPRLTSDFLPKLSCLHLLQLRWWNLQNACKVLDSLVNPQAPRSFHNPQQQLVIVWNSPACWVRHSKVPKDVWQYKWVLTDIVSSLEEHGIRK